MVTQQQGVMLNPESLVQGGGPPVQQNLLIEEARFVYFDYDGKANKTFAARLKLKGDDGTQYVQHYSVGDPARWMPSEDGRQAIPLGTTKGINDNSNFGILLKEFANAGYPRERMSSDIGTWDGSYAYWDGVPAPKRTGLASAPAADGQAQREAIVLVPTKFHSFGGGVAAAPVGAVPPGAPPAPSVPAAPPAPAAPAAPAAPPAATPAAGGDLNSKALVSLTTVSNARGGNFALNEVVPQIMTDYGQDPQRDALMGHLMSPDFAQFLASQGFQVNGMSVTRS